MLQKILLFLMQHPLETDFMRGVVKISLRVLFFLSCGNTDMISTFKIEDTHMRIIPEVKIQSIFFKKQNPNPISQKTN